MNIEAGKHRIARFLSSSGARLGWPDIRTSRFGFLPTAWLALNLAGCTGISIAPRCPNELAVGDEGTISAEVINPGAVPEYKWEAIPADAGTFEEDDLPVTKFMAEEAGEVTIQLTASDGLFQVISQCHISIVAAGVEPAVAVELEFSPTTPLAGQAITVTCVSAGDPDAVSFEITQTGGADVNEIPLTGDTIVFTPMEAGTLMFQCVGESADDMMSEPDTISITVGEDPRGGR